MKFDRIALAATAFLALAGASGVASAEMTKMVGGAAMYPSKNIIQNAVNSKDNTTLERDEEKWTPVFRPHSAIILWNRSRS